MPKVAFRSLPAGPFSVSVAQNGAVTEAQVGTPQESLPANQPPVAGDDTATVVSGGTVSIPVLANDTDPEGGPLTVTAAEAMTGSVTIGADGTLSYTAPAGFSGTDTVTYTVADSEGATAEGRVTVTVEAAAPENQPPLASDDTATAVSGETVSIPVLANDMDPEGGPLTITAAKAASGSVTVGADGTLSYTTPGGFSGTDTITYTVADAEGATAEGRVTVTVTVEATAPESGDQDLAIIASRTTGTAPASIFFDAVATGFGVARPQHDLRYKWTFGDPVTFKALRRSHLTPWGNDGNVAYGPWAAHCFRKPGTYLVTCEATDGKVTKTRTVQVKVEDQSATYSTTNTIVLAHDGDFAGAPAGTRIASTDLSEGLVGAKNRIYVKRGGTYTGWGSMGSGRTHLCLQPWGEGDDPVVDTTSSNCSFSRNSAEEIILSQVNFSGGYDVTTASGPTSFTTANGGTSTIKGINIDPNVDCPITIDGCTFQKHAICIFTHYLGDSVKSAVMFNDCTITAWHDYGHFGGFRRGAFVGTRFEQHYDAMGGGDGSKSDTHPRHSPIRVNNLPAEGYLILDNCEFFNNAGHPLKNKLPDHQNNVRFNSTNHKYSGGNFSRVLGDSGDALFGGGSNKTTDLTPPVNWIIDKVIFIHSPSVSKAFGISRGGTTLRNFLVIVPKFMEYEQGYTGGILELETYNPNKFNQENADQPIRIYSGSVVEWIDPVEFGNTNDPAIYNNDSIFTDQRIDNIVRYSPNLRKPIADDVTLVPMDLNPLYRGLKWKGQTTRLPNYASPSALVAADVAANAVICRAVHGPTTIGHSIDDNRFTVGSDGTVRRSGTGTLTAGQMVQILVTHSYSDRQDYEELISLRIVPGGTSPAVQRMVALPVPSGTLLAESPSGLHALDYIDGTLRGAKPVRGAVKPA